MSRSDDGQCGGAEVRGGEGGGAAVELPRRRNARGDLIAATSVLGTSAVLILEALVHASRAHTRSPWGTGTLPLLCLVVLVGVAASVWLLAKPVLRWPLWARLVGLAGLFVLAGEVFGFVGVALELPPERRPSEERVQCAHDMSETTGALVEYASANGEFPDGSAWERAFRDSHRSSLYLTCPSSPGHPVAYAYNGSLSRRGYGAVAGRADLVVLLESDAGEGATGGPELLPDTPRHLGGDNYGFADGHVQWLPRKKLPDGSWAKGPDADWVRWKP